MSAPKEFQVISPPVVLRFSILSLNDKKYNAIYTRLSSKILYKRCKLNIRSKEEILQQ